MKMILCYITTKIERKDKNCLFLFGIKKNSNELRRKIQILYCKTTKMVYNMIKISLKSGMD